MSPAEAHLLSGDPLTRMREWGADYDEESYQVSITLSFQECGEMGSDEGRCCSQKVATFG